MKVRCADCMCQYLQGCWKEVQSFFRHRTHRMHNSCQIRGFVSVPSVDSCSCNPLVSWWASTNWACLMYVISILHFMSLMCMLCWQVPFTHSSPLVLMPCCRKKERFLLLYQRSPQKENSLSQEKNLWTYPTDSGRKPEDGWWLPSGQPLSGRIQPQSVQTALRSISQRLKPGFKDRMLQSSFF